jgi:hypothetical protein
MSEVEQKPVTVLFWIVWIPLCILSTVFWLFVFSAGRIPTADMRLLFTLGALLCTLAFIGLQLFTTRVWPRRVFTSFVGSILGPVLLTWAGLFVFYAIGTLFGWFERSP